MNYAMLFPGQGSQYLHMCHGLYVKSGEIRKIFKTSSEILGYDLWKMIDNGDLSTLTRTQNAQPAVLTASYALYTDFMIKYEKEPEIVVGHSLGEISALVCTGSIPFDTAVAFVRKRSELMEHAFREKLGFSGIVTDMEQEPLEKTLLEMNAEGYVAITGYNSPNQFMVAGNKEMEKKLDDKIESLGGQYIPYRMIPMKVSAPYHSKLMNIYREDFSKMIEGVEFSVPNFPVFSTVNGKILQTSSEISQLLIDQMSSPILWNQVIEEMVNKNYDAYIDIGPNKIIKNLIKEKIKTLHVFAADNSDEEEKIVSLFKK
ncbi:ACP S-malonyltransferase [Anaerocolumna sp.]|uniref:ACP S-malonyltransferase n=1 Tax=Anaerocolumna sp. TaxID=2041569 RepID=UPI0028B1AD2A|nr:ACP S-malonyltransferase [Anaerocolumna sp.]